MKKIILLIICGALLIPAIAVAQNPPLPDVKEVTDRLDDLYRSDSSHSTTEMTVVNERGTRKLELEQWTRGEDEALIVIRSPRREAGTATLKTDEGLWNYAPRADRLVRVPSGLLSDAWMGSHFSNDDLVRETSYDDDYETTLSWVKEKGKQRLKVTMKPNEGAPVVYTRIDFYVMPESYIPVRSEYYDKGKMVRRMDFTEVKEIGGRKIPTVMTLRPMDEPDEKTEIRYKEIEFNAKVDSKIFTRRGLRRAAKRR